MIVEGHDACIDARDAERCSWSDVPVACTNYYTILKAALSEGATEST